MVAAGLAAAPSGVEKFPSPIIEYRQLAPMLIVFGVALAGVLVEAFVNRSLRYYVQAPLAGVGLIAGFLWTVYLAGGFNWIGLHHDPSFHAAAMGAIGLDGPTLLIQGTILVLATLSLLLIAERRHASFTAQAAALPGTEAEQETMAAGITQTEVFPLMLFAVGGMLMFPASNDLLTMFVALEIMSLPLYLLCGLARRRRLLSQEAAVKYFLLGAFSSAFFLYGTALLYGYAGSVRLADISTQLGKDAGSETLMLAGVALLSVGLLFKIGAVPFHMWKPDVYQGAPTPVTALMASCTLVAGFGALMRVYYVGFETLRWDWRPFTWGVAILTMVVGAIIAITQTDLKRLLAYSSIAHAGFLLTGIVAVTRDGLAGALFYLVAYGFTTVGAFAVITMVRDGGGEAAHLSRWAGLGRKSPVVAGVFSFFLLAFAGIPLTSGFTGKFAVFKAAVEGHATPLVVVGVLSSAVAAFFYVRVIVVMFFSEPEADGPTVVAGPMTAAAVALGVAATVVLGVLPQPMLDLAGHAATQMFVR
ncbi:NADH-quinone oxidoreductase subunit NuoN [Spirillospora sp. NPDC052269]